MYGNKIKELRTEKGLTQSELAIKLQTSQRNISKYELELLDLNTELIIKICKFFEVSADYLLGLEPELAESYDLNTTFIKGIKVKDVLISLRKLSPNNKKEALKYLSYLSSTQ